MDVIDIHTKAIGKLIRKNKKLTVFVCVWFGGLWINNHVRDEKIRQLEEKVSELESKGNVDGGED